MFSICKPFVPTMLKIFIIFGISIACCYSHNVAIPLLARNKEHLLPFFFDTIDNLNFPKNNISIWIWSDHNIDNTSEIVKEWVNNTHALYNEIRLFTKEHPSVYEEELSPFDWPPSRYNHIMEIKEKALLSAIAKNYDYLFNIDMDNFLLNPNTLSILIDTKLPLVAPMLTSGHYTNFWAAMDAEGYYKRDDSYLPIVKGEVKGCHRVPMIHSTYLIDLKALFPDGIPKNEEDDDDFDSSIQYDDFGQRREPLREKLPFKNIPKLTYNSAYFPNYNYTTDDIILFAKSAEKSGTPMMICNNVTFGYLLQPLKSSSKLHDINKEFSELRLEILNKELVGLNVSKYVSPPKRASKDKLGFDMVYLVNLEKRVDRRERMEKCFDALGLDVKILKGVDGNKLNESYLKAHNISQLTNYKDPYHKRDLTMGEIGCFLSHYQIWREVLANDYDKVLVFEDDIQFESGFRSKVEAMMKEPDRMNLGWDLIYLGRKRLVPPEREKYVKDSDVLVWPDYSYWTLSYALSKSGARKLVHCSQLKDATTPEIVARNERKRKDSDRLEDFRVQNMKRDNAMTYDDSDNCPLNKLVPVDEYIPIMFDMHPEDEWKKHFPKRDLVAFSAYPLLVNPTHYTGDEGYVSDTEDSPVISPAFVAPKPGESELRKLDPNIGYQYSQFIKESRDLNIEKNMRDEL